MPRHESGSSRVIRPAGSTTQLRPETPGASAGPVQHDKGDLVDVRLLGVHDGHLLTGRGEHRRAGPRNGGRVLGTERDPQVGRPRLHVELAAEGHVDGNHPVLRDGDLLVQGERERWHVAHPHPADAPALDARGGLHRADGGVDADDGLRLGRR